MTIRRDPQREQLELFHAFSGELPARDAQDLMAYPFFSLAKSKRTAPIDFRTSNVTVRVSWHVPPSVKVADEAIAAGWRQSGESQAFCAGTFCAVELTSLCCAAELQ